MKSNDRVLIFDTTLRDGEQCPGASMNLRQKLEVARQLEKLGVDIIEAGFPCISDGDFEAVSTIARTLKNTRIAGLARCVENDVRQAAAAVAPAGDRGRIHTFLATSPLHREYKLKKTKEEVLDMAVRYVKMAASLVKDVEFSPEDASRTELDYLAQVIEAVIDAGATTVNIPDTVGFTTPGEYSNMIRYLIDHVSNINKEVIMALTLRPEAFGFAPGSKVVGVNTREIVKTSRVVSRMSGMAVQRSKAIVGENAFAHSSGIHQHGILAKRETYEVINPADVGWGETELPLTKHSGRAAVKARLEKLGHELSEEELTQVFERFKKVGDSKKFVYDDDLAALVNDSLDTHEGKWKMVMLQFTAGSSAKPTATVTLEKDGKSYTDCAIGNGPVNASFKAIDRITRTRGDLVDYAVRSTTAGQDALGEVSVKVQFGDDCRPVSGKGAASDVVEASARAYLNAVNRSIVLSEQSACQ